MVNVNLFKGATDSEVLNKAIKKFPSNIIAKIHHLDPQTFFDGKDMFDDDKEDFKI